MGYVFILWMSLLLVTSAHAQVSVNIGINLPIYPELVRVPGYPVYYAPRLDSNFFFYDGMYWVYQRDNWYASSWYNGPWRLVAPDFVPLFVLRVPVRYYRNPPGYFRGWRPDASPRWGDHWGNDWAQHRRGWDKWNRSSAPAPAPLPVYQRQYSGEHYPQIRQQRDIHNENYRYKPHDALVRRHDQAPAVQGTPAPSRQGRQEMPEERKQRPPDRQHATPPPPPQPMAPIAPHAQSPQRGGDEAPRLAPAQAPARQDPASRPGNDRHEKGSAQASGRGQGQEKEHETGEGHGQGRNR